MPLSSASLKSVFKQFSFLHNSWGINSRDLLHLNQISRWSISMQLVQAAVNTGRRSMCLSLKEAGQVKRYFCHRGWCLLGCPEDCETSKRAQSCYSHLMDSTTPHSSISPSGWLYCVCVFSNLTSFLFIFFCLLSIPTWTTSVKKRGENCIWFFQLSRKNIQRI